MSALEIFLILVSVTQPLCVGAFAYLGLTRTLSRSGLGSIVGSRRERLAAFRFYECSTYSRLSSAFVYPLFIQVVFNNFIAFNLIKGII